MKDTSAIGGERESLTDDQYSTNRRVKRESGRIHTAGAEGIVLENVDTAQKEEGKEKSVCVSVCCVKLAGRKKWSNNVRTRRHTSEEEIPLLLKKREFFLFCFVTKKLQSRKNGGSK